MKKPFRSRAIGRGEIKADGSLDLVQRVEDEGEQPRERHWRMRRTAPGHYTGTMTEARGPVTVEEVSGRYRFRFRMDGNVAVEQWLTPMPGRPLGAEPGDDPQIWRPCWRVRRHDPQAGLVARDRFEAQGAGNKAAMFGIVGRVALAVVNRQFTEIEGRDAVQAGSVDAQLIGVRAALVVGVDAAGLAEMMLGGAGVEAVGGELVRALR